MSRDKHKQALQQICDHPSHMGIDGVIMSIKEPTIWEGNDRRKTCDVIFIRGYGIVDLIEYKTGHKHKGEAVEQLNETERFVRRYFDAHEVRRFYVHNDMEIEQVHDKPRSPYGGLLPTSRMHT